VRAQIITIGDEILIGQIVDTNSAFIGKELNRIGVSVHQIVSIQDDEQEILDSLAFAKAHVDIVIVTGGLGPTKDDVTKHTFCKFFNDTLIEDADTLAHIEHIFKVYIKREMLPQNRTQAMVPSKATVLKNRFGTAPGMWIEEDGVVFISMPGVPYEMTGLMEHEVLPRIQATFKLPYIVHRTVLTYGMGESQIAQRIAQWEDTLPEVIKLAYLPSLGKVRLRLSTVGDDKEITEQSVEERLSTLLPLIEDIFVGYEEDGPLEALVGRLFTGKRKTLAVAESCTGGAIAQAITAIPGASSYFQGSVVTYATQSKIAVLGVKAATIKTETVVSKAVAIEMAAGVQKLYGTDYAISTTGNAGPNKGDADAPVGTVFIGIATPTGVDAFEFAMGNKRERVIGKTVTRVFQMLQEEIVKN